MSLTRITALLGVLVSLPVASEELDNWVCEYEMHLRQHMAMRVEGENPLVENSIPVERVQRSYPIKIDTSGGGDFAELSFRDCKFCACFRGSNEKTF